MAKKAIARKPLTKKMPVKRGAIKGSENSVSYESEWESMYVLTEHWESDMKFYEDEINFLNKLLAKYMTWLVDGKHIEKIRSIANELLTLGRQRSAAQQHIEKHLTHLTDLVQNPFSHEEQRCKDEHVEIEAEVTRLTREFRELKKNVFKITEYVMEIEKSRHLLNS